MLESSKSLVACALAHFVNDGTLYVFPIVYVFLILSHDLDQTLVAVLASLTSVSAIVAAPFVGRRSDERQSYGELMALGVLVMGLAVFASSASFLFLHKLVLFAVLVPIVLVLGVGSSFYHPLAASILNEKWERSRRGRAMGVNGALGSFGVVVFPIIANSLFDSYSLASIALLGVWLLLTVLVVYSLMKGFRFSKEGSQGATTDFRAIAKRVFPLTVVSFVRGLTQGIIVFLPTFLVVAKHVSLSYVALASSAVPILGVAGQPVFGYISDRLGRRLALGVSGVGQVIAMLLFIAEPNFLLAEVFLGIFGLFNYTSFPLIMGVATEIAPPGATTRASSIVWGVGNVGGGALGPIAVALFALPIAFGSLAGAFYALTLITILSVVLLPLVPRSPSSSIPVRENEKDNAVER